MPPDAARKGSQERWQSFQNWVDNGFPLGTVTPVAVVPTAADRVRRDARDLTAAEVATLGTAFQGLMDRSPDDATSYFAIAGQHWYPDIHCHHHDTLYHPWHRAYVRTFEEALRSVPGCAEVTLPYWDVTAAPPDFLYAAPFDSYTLPCDVHLDEDDPDRSYPAGYRTLRNPAATVLAGVDDQLIPAAISWHPHDSAHVATGPTMSVPAAAFDPIFWFFHCNWDRLWWEWQQAMQATSQWSFRSTVTSGQTEFLVATGNVLEGTDPYKRAEQLIDLASAGVGYAAPQTTAVVLAPEPSFVGSDVAGKRMRVRSAPVVSVRLKDFDAAGVALAGR